MCLSCACGKPNEKHGDDRHITLQDVQAAAEASDTAPQEVVTNIQQGFDQFGHAEAAGVGARETAANETTGQRTTSGDQESGNNQQSSEQR